MPRRWSATALALVVSGLAVATASAELTREQVIRRGDNICHDMETRQDAARKRHRPYEPFAEYHLNHAALGFAIARITKRGVERFEPVVSEAPADGDRWRLRRFVRGMRAQIPRLRNAARAARAGDKQRVDELVEVINRHIRRYSRHARAYGFSNCGWDNS
jgi:hypothetical protein